MAQAKKGKKGRFPGKLRIFETALAFLILCCFGVLLLGFFPLSHRVITRKAEAMLKQPWMDTCSLGSVRVTAWKGVSLHRIRIAGKIVPDSRISVAVADISLKTNLFTAFVNRKRLFADLLGQIGAIRKCSPDDPVGALNVFAKAASSVEYLDGISVAGIDVVKTGTGQPDAEIKGVSGDFTFPEGRRNAFSGSVEISSAFVGGVETASRLSGDILYESGLLRVTELKGKVFKGRLKLNADLNLNSGTLTGAKVNVENLDLGEMSRMGDTAAGYIIGKADASFQFDSSALAPDSLAGKGKFTVSDFTIRHFPFQQSLVTFLMYPGLRSISFKRLSSDIRLRPGQLLETDLTGDGDSMSIKSEGWVRADGMLNQKLVCTLTEEGVSVLPEFAQKTLEETKNGGRVLRCRLYGVIQNPKVSVESKVILQKAVKNMFESVKSEMQMWMR